MSSPNVVDSDPVGHQVQTADFEAAIQVSPLLTQEAQTNVSQSPNVYMDPPPGNFDPLPKAETIDLTMHDCESIEPHHTVQNEVSMTNPTNLDDIPKPPICHTMTLLSNQVKSCRLFLDICAGSSRPLSKALLALHADVISFDILLDSRMDILDDFSFEALLKLCSSGVVAYGAASPSCAQYSRLKLRNDGGPPPLRTPEHLQGIPGLDAPSLAKVQESYTMLSRCLRCLSLIHSAGGHVHLEQPSTAMSWLESETQSFIRSIGLHCINLAACLFGKDWRKHWMFSSSFPPLRKLGGTCPHPPGSHQQIAGRTNQAGDFLSRDTACYPDPLALAFADLVFPLFSNDLGDISWDSRLEIIPIKAIDAFPYSVEDGGGLNSEPDWSTSDRAIPDSFKHLRQQWLNMVITNRLDKKLMAACQLGSPEAPFTETDIQPFRKVLEDFLQAQGQPVDWSIREHQPMHLKILQSFSCIMGDEDTSLFQSLLDGVCAGFQHDIPLSGIFPQNQDPPDQTTPLSVHFSNWNSAEENPELTRELVQEEIDKGWVYEFPGSAADAQVAFPCGVAIGKLGIAISDQRPPRLVVDNSVCGLNSRCYIPEKSTLPSAKDVIRSYPIRETQNDLMGFSLDIKSAHKRVVLREAEQGLVGFSMGNRIFFYRVCPFGASFSAAWWSRVGGFLLRVFHRLIWLAHVAFLYVDDFFIYQDHQIMPCSAALLCIFCLLTKVPISWKKCELHGALKWIGWNFHVRSGFLSVPEDKLLKLAQYLKDLLPGNRTSRKRLKKAIGVAMWLTQLWPFMRIWLHHLYKDLYSLPASLFSVNSGDWGSIVDALDNSLKFQHQPAHTGIPVGGVLVAVGHHNIHSFSDLHTFRLRDRMWLRIRDPGSSRRKLSDDSRRVIHMFQDWISGLHPVRSLRPRPYWLGQAAADAMASGTRCQIGGFVTTQFGQSKWFSEVFSHEDFSSIQLELKPDLQKSITCLETLAQIALLWMTSKFFPSHRLPICLRSLSDNTGAEASSNKLFTMSRPLCFFVEKLCLLSAKTGMEIDVGHIPGHDNQIADDLSRWDESTPIPHSFVQADRVRISLKYLWIDQVKPSFAPPNLDLPWSLPT